MKYQGVVCSIPGFSSLSDETLNRGPHEIFHDKMLTRTDCDEAEDYVVPNVLNPRDLVFRPDIGHKLYHHHEMSRVVRKPAFCMCENKDADQLRGNREADQRLCFATRIAQSLFYLNPKFQASSHIQ